jgi:glycerol-3-phosphate acyltransferase PlsY
MKILLWALTILGGYLIGSILPAYFLGRILKKIDIREHGTKNAGTMNVYHLLGLGPAAAAAIFDVSKGLLVMFLAYLLGASPLLVHLAGFAVILGHVFPFYLRFRGGQGVAAATAIMIYYLVLFYQKHWLPWESLLLLAFCVFSFVHISKKGEIVGATVLPVLSILILVFSSFQKYQVFILSIIAYIFLVDILNIRRFKLLSLPLGVNDNFSIALLSASSMYVFLLF